MMKTLNSLIPREWRDYYKEKKYQFLAYYERHVPIEERPDWPPIYQPHARNVIRQNLNYDKLSPARWYPTDWSLDAQHKLAQNIQRLSPKPDVRVDIVQGSLDPIQSPRLERIMDLWLKSSLICDENRLIDIVHDPQNVFVTMEIDDMLAGAVGWRTDLEDNYAEILGLAVAYPYRNQGISGYLMRTMEGVLRENDIDVVWASVPIGVQDLFQDWGFNAFTSFVSDWMALNSHGIHRLRDYREYERQRVEEEHLEYAEVPIIMEKFLNFESRIRAEYDPDSRQRSRMMEIDSLRWYNESIDRIPDDYQRYGIHEDSNMYKRPNVYERMLRQKWSLGNPDAPVLNFMPENGVDLFEDAERNLFLAADQYQQQQKTLQRVDLLQEQFPGIEWETMYPNLTSDSSTTNILQEEQLEQRRHEKRLQGLKLEKDDFLWNDGDPAYFSKRKVKQFLKLKQIEKVKNVQGMRTLYEIEEHGYDIGLSLKPNELSTQYNIPGFPYLPEAKYKPQPDKNNFYNIDPLTGLPLYAPKDVQSRNHKLNYEGIDFGSNNNNNTSGYSDDSDSNNSTSGSNNDSSYFSSNGKTQRSINKFQSESPYSIGLSPGGIFYGSLGQTNSQQFSNINTNTNNTNYNQQQQHKSQQHRKVRLISKYGDGTPGDAKLEYYDENGMIQDINVEILPDPDSLLTKLNPLNYLPLKSQNDDNILEIPVYPYPNPIKQEPKIDSLPHGFFHYPNHGYGLEEKQPEILRTVRILLPSSEYKSIIPPGTHFVAPPPLHPYWSDTKGSSQFKITDYQDRIRAISPRPLLEKPKQFLRSLVGLDPYQGTIGTIQVSEDELLEDNDITIDGKPLHGYYRDEYKDDIRNGLTTRQSKFRWGEEIDRELLTPDEHLQVIAASAEEDEEIANWIEDAWYNRDFDFKRTLEMPQPAFEKNALGVDIDNWRSPRLRDFGSPTMKFEMLFTLSPFGKRPDHLADPTRIFPVYHPALQTASRHLFDLTKRLRQYGPLYGQVEKDTLTYYTDEELVHDEEFFNKNVTVSDTLVNGPKPPTKIPSENTSFFQRFFGSGDHTSSDNTSLEEDYKKLRHEYDHQQRLEDAKQYDWTGGAQISSQTPTGDEYYNDNYNQNKNQYEKSFWENLITTTNQHFGLDSKKSNKNTLPSHHDTPDGYKRRARHKYLTSTYAELPEDHHYNPITFDNLHRYLHLLKPNWKYQIVDEYGNKTMKIKDSFDIRNPYQRRYEHDELTTSELTPNERKGPLLWFEKYPKLSDPPEIVKQKLIDHSYLHDKTLEQPSDRYRYYKDWERAILSDNEKKQRIDQYKKKFDINNPHMRYLAEQVGYRDPNETVSKRLTQYQSATATEYSKRRTKQLQTLFGPDIYHILTNLDQRYNIDGKPIAELQDPLAVTQGFTTSDYPTYDSTNQYKEFGTKIPPDSRIVGIKTAQDHVNTLFGNKSKDITVANTTVGSSSDFLASLHGYKDKNKSELSKLDYYGQQQQHQQQQAQQKDKPGLFSTLFGINQEQESSIGLLFNDTQRGQLQHDRQQNEFAHQQYQQEKINNYNQGRTLGMNELINDARTRSTPLSSDLPPNSSFKSEIRPTIIKTDDNKTVINPPLTSKNESFIAPLKDFFTTMIDPNKRPHFQQIPSLPTTTKGTVPQLTQNHPLYQSLVTQHPEKSEQDIIAMIEQHINNEQLQRDKLITNRQEMVQITIDVPSDNILHQLRQEPDWESLQYQKIPQNRYKKLRSLPLQPVRFPDGTLPHEHQSGQLDINNPANVLYTNKRLMEQNTPDRVLFGRRTSSTILQRNNFKLDTFQDWTDLVRNAHPNFEQILNPIQRKKFLQLKHEVELRDATLPKLLPTLQQSNNIHPPIHQLQGIKHIYSHGYHPTNPNPSSKHEDEGRTELYRNDKWTYNGKVTEIEPVNNWDNISQFEANNEYRWAQEWSRRWNLGRRDREKRVGASLTPIDDDTLKHAITPTLGGAGHVFAGVNDPEEVKRARDTNAKLRKQYEGNMEQLFIDSNTATKERYQQIHDKHREAYYKRKDELQTKLYRYLIIEGMGDLQGQREIVYQQRAGDFAPTHMLPQQLWDSPLAGDRYSGDAYITERVHDPWYRDGEYKPEPFWHPL